MLKMFKRERDRAKRKGGKQGCASYFIELSYLIASVLFILGLRSLTRPDKARRGMQQAAVGMLFAIAGTLLHHEIVDYRWIAAGLASRHRHRLPDGHVGADDGDAATNRASP